MKILFTLRIGHRSAVDFATQGRMVRTPRKTDGTAEITHAGVKSRPNTARIAHTIRRMDKRMQPKPARVASATVDSLRRQPPAREAAVRLRQQSDRAGRFFA